MESEARSRQGWLNNLPQEIFINIFMRLPIKTLIISKLVRKDWNVQLSSPEFVKTHLKHAKESHHTAYHKQVFFRTALGHRQVAETLDYNTFEQRTVSFPFSNRFENPEVLASCDGLVLISNGESNYYLWNPSTRACLQLPWEFSFFQQAFRLYGLAFDSSTESYKVIRVNRFCTSRHSNSGWGEYSISSRTIREPEGSVYDMTRVNVYDCKAGAWKRISDGFSHKVLANSQSVDVNGMPHWLVASEEKMKYVPIYFDLSDEKFKELTTPDWVSNKESPAIGVLDGSLCMFREQDNNRLAEIWVMKQYGVKESWTLLMSFQCSDFVRAFCFTTNDEVAIQRRVTSIRKSIDIYDRKTQTSTRRMTYQHKNGFKMVEYVESLVSPRGWYGNI